MVRKIYQQRKINSIIDNLLNELDEIQKLVDKLLDHSEIEYKGSKTVGDFTFIMPDYSWKELDGEGKHIQTNLLRKYNKWYEILKLLFSEVPPDISNRIDKLNDSFLMWTERKEMNWELPATINDAKAKYHQKLNKFKDLLLWLKPEFTK